MYKYQQENHTIHIRVTIANVFNSVAKLIERISFVLVKHFLCEVLH